MKLTTTRCLALVSALPVVTVLSITGLAATSLAATSLAATGPSTTGPSTTGLSPARPSALTAGSADEPASAGIGPPVASGRLRVTGSLRDGGVVRASGLSWRPGALPRGDRLLSFEVGYAWQACAALAAGQATDCTAAADSTVAPYAARRYLVGHADTGTYLRVRVTAAEVVETDPATFAFSILRSSVIVVTARRVRGYPAGRTPVTEFLNGVPEHRTGSAEEYFQVAPPHFAAADSTPAQWYRIDRGPWRAMPSGRVFYTGTLAPGPHQVAVRTANRAGRSTAGFGWRVVPLPEPEPCTRPHGRSCWYPPHLNSSGHPMRWDWQIGRVTPLQRTGRRAVDIYDIDGFLTTRAEVRQIHDRWQASTLAHPKAVCYMDLAWEDYRPDASPAPGGRYFPAAVLGRVYFGFPQERWVDFRQLDELKPMLDERISRCARAGFDAVELDDIDNFDPPSTTGFHLTVGDAQNYLAWALNDVHRHGMTVLWKNAPGLAWWGVRYADGAVVEECYIYHECFASWQRGTRQDGITCSALTGPTPCGWDVFTADRTARQPTGKWVGEAEYDADGFVCNPGQHCSGSHAFARYCRLVYAPPDGFAAVKFDVNLDAAMFFPCPRGA
jgi:Glycoside-hydrolase family GH114